MAFTEEADAYAGSRAAMVEDLRHRIHDPRVLAAFAAVPRERFVVPELRYRAYDDSPLSIGYGQTISQPLVVGIMLELLALTGEEKVLDIGTGSGYQAALLALLAREVVTVERVPELTARAAAVLEELGYRNVSVHLSGPVLGRPEDAPYDAIICAAASPSVPRVLVDQLKEGGRLVLPVGQRSDQELVLVRRRGAGYTASNEGPCRFVPLIGAGAFEAQAEKN